ncbi:MAG TPA: ATP phosphoribosyltransferase regulatory subunit, partial [Candidatus Saccharimonadia bacterium]|nr:ATP phosphoribosyltransferase regulatory subunit [Candidatus Saccharimonadia bacterium]
TPTVSRMVAAKRQELSYPLRWYSIPSLWRYERPQRGRLREHWQLNVDIFGVADTSAELEIITLVDAVFKAFGAEHDMYEIRLNHRGLIDYLLADYLGLGEKVRHDVGKLIDRFHKMEAGTFVSKLDEILTAKQRETGVTEKLMAVLGAKSVSDLPAEALQQPATRELQELLLQLKQAGVQAVFDGSLMRGFDYYTGVVFEVFDMNPDNNRSMLGGGRYDGLVGLFGVNPIPTVGFGWGDVTLANFLDGHGLVPKNQPETLVYLASVGDVEVNDIASALRYKGVNVAVDSSSRKVGDKLKNAGKKAIPYVLIVGEEELKSGKLKLKDLASGKETVATAADIVKKLGGGNGAGD